LTVNSLTSGTNLIDTSLTTGSDAIIVALPYGHNIEVFYGIEVSAAPPMSKTGGFRDATLSFTTSVVPEPISSVLFITGSMLLAGRRFMKSGSKKGITSH
jgi:hypothetical protein